MMVRVRILDVCINMADMVVAEYTMDLTKVYPSQSVELVLPPVADASRRHNYRMEVTRIEKEKSACYPNGRLTCSCGAKWPEPHR